MPCKITSGKGARFKEYGLHNGSRCYLRAVSLHEEDAVRLQGNEDDEVVLDHLPQALWMEVESGLKQQVPGAPTNWSPGLTPSDGATSLMPVLFGSFHACPNSE